MPNLDFIQEVFGIMTEGTSESTSAKIFEAEQANLYVEPVHTIKILSKALGLALSTLLQRRIEDERHIELTRKVFKEQVLHPVQSQTNSAIQVLRTALINAQEIEGMRWIGGWIFQKDVFVFVYGSLRIAAELLIAFRENDGKKEEYGHDDCISEVLNDIYSTISNFKLEVSQMKDLISSHLHPWIYECLCVLEDEHSLRRLDV